MRTFDIGSAGDPVVAELLERIDDPARPCVPFPAGRVIAVPTTWGPRRVEALLRAMRRPDAVTVPRAVALARSHCDATLTRCAVVETRLVPATGGHWSMHVVRRTAGQWSVESGLIATPDEAPAEWADPIARCDLLVVDGPADQVDDALAALPRPAGGAVRADRDLIARHGAPPRPIGEMLARTAVEPPSPARRRRLWATAAVAVAMAVIGVGWSVVHARSTAPVGAFRTERVGTVSVEVPGDWERTDLADDRPADGAGERAVFADPDDGARIVVVVTTLRAGSTRQSVAVSLRNRLAQRGDDVVREFAADTSFAGRRVISYRETPASGPPVAWYVHVADDVQTSVGCQRGTGEDAIAEACAATVASLH